MDKNSYDCSSRGCQQGKFLRIKGTNMAMNPQNARLIPVKPQKGGV